MTIRQTISFPNNVLHLESGYLGRSVQDDFKLPSNGIQDIDRALFDLFDKELNFVVGESNVEYNNVSAKKVPVLFAGGERFAYAKRLKPIRDKNGILTLPLIAIKRTNIQQSVGDLSGRGINQNTGELIVKRRLSTADKNYQNIINKLGLSHLNENNSLPSTERTTGELSETLEVQQGGLLSPGLKNNIYEFIVIPQPQFISVTYEVIFWTQFMKEMNKMINHLFNSFLPQGHRSFLLKTRKGYTFSAFIDEQISSNDNFDDFTEQEKILKHTFNVTVPSYILPNLNGDASVPYRKYYSAVDFEFKISNYNGTQMIEKDQLLRQKPGSNDFEFDKFILTDFEQDPSGKQKPTDLDTDLVQRTFFNPLEGTKFEKYVDVISSSPNNGETVFYITDEKLMDLFLK